MQKTERTYVHNCGQEFGQKKILNKFVRKKLLDFVFLNKK